METREASSLDHGGADRPGHQGESGRSHKSFRLLEKKRKDQLNLVFIRIQKVFRPK